MRKFILRNRSIHAILSSAFVIIILLTSCQFFNDPAKNIELNPLFTDNMVLQQNQDIPIWGRADAGGEVIIELADQQEKVLVDTSGRWSAKLSPIIAGGPYELKIIGE